MSLSPLLLPLLSPALHLADQRVRPWPLGIPFSAGAQGVWFDPSDLGSMYQESGGITPAAVGQTIGMRLDKRLGLALGAELVLPSGWITNGSWTSPGTNSVTAIAAGSISNTGAAVVAGKSYEVSYRVNAVTAGAGGMSAQVGLTNGAVHTAIGDYREVITAAGVALGLTTRGDGLFRGTVINTSVRELPGNHAIQATAGSRPILRQDANARYYAEIDGIDDAVLNAAGGGASTGFFFCAAITVGGGAGTARTIWSDAGANTGYRVRVNATNQLELAAGNGVAFTSIATVATLPVAETHVVSVWDDGVNLKAQIDGGAVASIARPVVSAGTAGFTMFKDNGAASSFFGGREYGSVALGRAPTAIEITKAQRLLAARAALSF